MPRSKTEKIGGSKIIACNEKPVRRLLIGVPTTGKITMDWALHRWGQTIPCNWSSIDHFEWMNQDSPIDFYVANARNLIVRSAIEMNVEWLLFIDHDVLLPPLFFQKMNQYMAEKKVPIVGGLYFTKSVPSEPLTYRGRGNSFYSKWKIGDKVWLDGMGLGCHMIHMSIMRLMWEESEEYLVAGQRVRRVFEEPFKTFYDPELKALNIQSGTEDLAWYTRIMNENVLGRSGWKQVAKRKNPFLCDTALFCWHINEDRVRYPMRGEQLKFIRK